MIEDFSAQKQLAETDVKQLEEDFQNTKLNPYGITKFDFTKRNDIKDQILRLEGAIEALVLAKEHCDELKNVPSSQS